MTQDLSNGPPDSCRVVPAPHFAPINNIPVEILSEIMCLVCFGYDSEMNPLHLSHVCRRWREVTLETKSLWNYIRVSSFRDQGDLASGIDDYLLALLERSRGGGITLDLWFPPLPAFCKALSIVSHYAVDITTLIYSTAEDEGDESAFAKTLHEIEFPNLHSLSIECPENSGALLKSFLDLLERSLDRGLELNLNCWPDDIVEQLYRHPVSKRLKTLSVEFALFPHHCNTFLITKTSQQVYLPSLQQFTCTGFTSFLEHIQAHNMTELQLETLTYDVQGCKGFSPSSIPARCQRLATVNMRLEYEVYDIGYTPIFTNLTWISLFKVEYTGDIVPRIFLPNLTTLCFEMAKHDCSLPSDVTITDSSMICQSQIHLEDILRKDGLFGPMPKLQNLDIARLALHEGRVNPDRAIPLTYRFYPYNLRSLRIEECTRLDTFLESFHTLTNEAEQNYLTELMELQIDNCESFHDILSLRRRFAITRPLLAITGSLRTPESKR
ncbi:hypothetical protein CPB86DRAFT_873896 [Serendipita vermifera]|nr:hypothetical protein CPB86DRAFT_873896 [Serendipita vermifera]